MTVQRSTTDQNPACGARIHHGVRGEWLARLQELEQQYDGLAAAGRLLSGAHRRSSILTKEGVHVQLEAWYGVRVLFEVEAFLAEEFSSRAEAVDLLSDCTETALRTAESALSQRVELKVHPQWRPEILHALREMHSRTLVHLRTEPRAHASPAYRWRLPARAHLAAWEQLKRGSSAWQADRRLPMGHDWDSPQIVAALRNRGLRRVFVLHPILPSHSCETDVELLGAHRFDWLDLTETYLTAAPFDWFIRLGDYGDWDAEGWPVEHEALLGL